MLLMETELEYAAKLKDLSSPLVMWLEALMWSFWMFGDGFAFFTWSVACRNLK
jgi:hypothetical protein